MSKNFKKLTPPSWDVGKIWKLISIHDKLQCPETGKKK